MTIARMLRQTLTVARRDFIASVATPTFLIFLLAPLLMLALGTVGGMGAASMVGRGEEKLRIVAIVDPGRVATVAAIDRQLRALFPRRGEDSRPALEIVAPARNTRAQAEALFDSREHEVSAVLHGPLDRPEILHVPGARRDAEYLAQLAEQALRADRAGGAAPLSQADRVVMTRDAPSASAQGQLAYIGVFGLFFLTLLLAGQAVGTMAEEKSNKVIEVLAAAVPLESVFLGKLIGTFAVAVLFLIFWSVVLANLLDFLPVDMARAMDGLRAAVGGPAFGLLFAAYFTMAFMLLSAVFLGIGALASSQRELQMLSLPITIFQVAMFGFAAAASSNGGWLMTAATVFPFSSPFAMIARAADSPELWPHAAALAWQILWVAITIFVGARLFRRGVLKSGSPGLRLKRASP